MQERPTPFPGSQDEPITKIQDFFKTGCENQQIPDGKDCDENFLRARNSSKLNGCFWIGKKLYLATHHAETNGVKKLRTVTPLFLPRLCDHQCMHDFHATSDWVQG